MLQTAIQERWLEFRPPSKLTSVQTKRTESLILSCAADSLQKERLTIIMSIGFKTARFTEMSLSLVRDLPSDLDLLK